MKSFLDYLNEDVVPAALVTGGTISLDDEDTRASINMALAKVTSHCTVTPYIALNRIAKALAYFSIVLPKKVYLDGSSGVEVHELQQFGDKMGMTDQGEFVHEVPGKYYLFIRYSMAGLMGTFMVFAKVVDKEELDKLVSSAEKALAEECDAETQQRKAKDTAPRDEMHDVTSDEKKVGNKKAVAVSDKEKVDEGILDTVRSMNPFNQLANKLGPSNVQAAPKNDGKIMGNPDFNKKPTPAPVKEENLDEVSKKLLGRYIKGASHDVATRSALTGRHAVKSKASADQGDYNKAKIHDKLSDKAFAKSWDRRKHIAKAVDRLTKEETQIDEISKGLALKAMKASEKRSDDEWEADAAYDRLSDWKTHDSRAHRLRGHMKRKFGKKKIKTDGEDHLKDYDGYSGRQGVHTVNTHGKRAGLPPKEQVNRLKNNIRYSLGKHHKPNLPEETQLDELSVGKLVRYRNEADQDKKNAKHIMKKPAGYDDGSYEEIHAKRKKGLKLANKKLTGKAKVNATMPKHPYMEETQIDELSRETVARYKKAAESDKKTAEISADVSRSGRKDRGNSLKNRIEHGKEEKWLRGIAKKREKGIAMADKRLEEISGSLAGKYMTKAREQKKEIQDKINKDEASRAEFRKGLRRTRGLEMARDKLTGRGMAKVHTKEEAINEKLTKGMSAADVIHDFVHSDDPKFKGKSVKERQKMALGAYYGMHPEKSKK